MQVPGDVVEFMNLGSHKLGVGSKGMPMHVRFLKVEHHQIGGAKRIQHPADGLQTARLNLRLWAPRGDLAYMIHPFLPIVSRLKGQRPSDSFVLVRPVAARPHDCARMPALSQVLIQSLEKFKSFHNIVSLAN